MLQRRRSGFAASWLRLSVREWNSPADVRPSEVNETQRANNLSHSQERCLLWLPRQFQGAFWSKGVIAISRPLFSGSLPGVPAIRKAAYSASLCLLGRGSIHVAPLECLLSVCSMGVEDGTSRASAVMLVLPFDRGEPQNRLPPVVDKFSDCLNISIMVPLCCLRLCDTLTTRTEPHGELRHNSCPRDRPCNHP